MAAVPAHAASCEIGHRHHHRHPTTHAHTPQCKDGCTAQRQARMHTHLLADARNGVLARAYLVRLYTGRQSSCCAMAAFLPVRSPRRPLASLHSHSSTCPSAPLVISPHARLLACQPAHPPAPPHSYLLASHPNAALAGALPIHCIRILSPVRPPARSLACTLTCRSACPAASTLVRPRTCRPTDLSFRCAYACACAHSRTDAPMRRRSLHAHRYRSLFSIYTM